MLCRHLSEFLAQNIHFEYLCTLCEISQKPECLKNASNKFSKYVQRICNQKEKYRHEFRQFAFYFIFLTFIFAKYLGTHLLSH